jgi:hypothetical protein
MGVSQATRRHGVFSHLYAFFLLPFDSRPAFYLLTNARSVGITTTRTVENTFKKIDAALPVAGKAIYFAIAGARAKMIGKTYQDVLNFLQHEYTLPETEESWKKRQGESLKRDSGYFLRLTAMRFAFGTL